MRSKLISVLFLVLFFFFLFACYESATDSTNADFLINCLVAAGTVGAVIVALFGDALDPVKLRIEVPEQSNTVIDFAPGAVPVYCHHLRVVNLTPHKAVENCRVWLKNIFVEVAAGVWNEEIKFAVPRLMEWAPSQYSKEKRTFCTDQVFDFGQTRSNNGGFELIFYKEQLGTIQRHFGTGNRIKFIFYVTADNYQRHEEFAVIVDVVPSVNVLQGFHGHVLTPSRVTMA